VYQQFPRARALSRLALTGVLVALLGFGAAGCASGSPSASAGSSATASATASTAASPRAPAARAARLKALYTFLANVPVQDRDAFIQCMRQNGIPKFPDTLRLRAIQAAGITMRSAPFMTAVQACKSKLRG
jgi:hypothetical protein